VVAGGVVGGGYDSQFKKHEGAQVVPVTFLAVKQVGLPGVAGMQVEPHDEALTAAELERRMMEAAAELQFEKAALLRDRLRKILAKSGG
jgi:excinuclease UvrABC helicase subunit UvrB